MGYESSPLKLPSKVGAGNSTVSNSVPLSTQATMMSRQATTVVIRAPTAIGQKSLGVPAQVRGINIKATITIHWQRCSCRPKVYFSLKSSRCSTFNRTCVGNKGSQKLRDENDENATSAVQRE